jgi:hypothetical protein
MFREISVSPRVDRQLRNIASSALGAAFGCFLLLINVEGMLKDSPVHQTSTLTIAAALLVLSSLRTVAAVRILGAVLDQNKRQEQKDFYS